MSTLQELIKKEKDNKKEQIINTIKEFCKNNTSRQREDLYKFLSKEFDIELAVYDYDSTNDHAKFACDENWENSYTVNKTLELISEK